MSLRVAQATPTAADVVSGSAAVVQSGNTTNVQMLSSRAVLNWDSLDTSYNETLNFLKESNFAVLNRVINGGPTQFYGSLFAENGSVFFVNTRGLVFGPTAYIQANQFVGSSLDITNTDFMNGQYAFSGGSGAVVNQGDIIAQSVALIGKKVLNSGTITSQEGYVVMAAGDRVLLGKPGESIFVELDSPGVLEPMDTQISDVPADVTNEGLINAENGTIVLAAGDSFSRAVANIGTLATAAGKITVDAARIENRGTINADAVEGDGGSISLTATEEVVLGSGSLTTANAGANGDGGEIIAYSPKNALFQEGALVEAKGGSESGNGGFFELSGLEYVNILGDIDLTSSSGRAGTFFIDPYNIIIDDSGMEEGDDDDGPWKAYGNSRGYSHLDIDVLEGYLDKGNVTISTEHAGGNHGCHSQQEGWVLFDADRDLQDGTSGGSGNSLNVYADDDIRLKSGINFSGDGSVYLNAGDDILLGWDGSNAGILLQGNGNLTMIAKSGDEITVGGSGITLNGNGNATLRANSHINVNADISTGGELKLFADDDHDYGGDMHSTASLHAGGNMEIRGNDVVLGGPVNAGGNLTITGRDCYPPEWGNVWAQSTLDAGGDIEISVTGKWNSNYYPGTITLEGDVTAGGDIKLYNDTYTTNLTGNGVKLQAGHDVFLLNDGLGDTKSENCTFLQGQDKLAIIAGAGDGVSNGQIHADLTKISVAGSSLTLEQDLDLDTANYLLGNQNNTHLTLISNNGSVTSTTGANAANQWKSIGAHAEDNITLAKSGSPETIKLGNSGTPGISLWAENGYIDIDGFNVKNSPINPTGSLEAGTTLDIDVVHGIDLGGDVTSGSDMRLHADTDTRWGHDVVVGGHINAGGTLDIEGTNVDIQSAHSDSDMSLYAHGLYAAGSEPEPLVGSGDVYVHGELTSGGKIELRATEFGPGGATTGPGFEDGTNPYSADGTIYLWDDVTAGDDILIHNNTWTEGGIKLDSNENIEIWGTLTGAGGLTLEAGVIEPGAAADQDNITLHKEVTAAGELEMTAGNDIFAHSKLTTTGTTGQGDMNLNAGDDIRLKATPASADSADDMTLTAHLDPQNPGSGDVEVSGTLNAGGNIEISSSDTTTYLYDDVTAGCDLFLNNNTWADDDVTLSAGGDARVRNGSTLTGEGDLTVKAVDNIEFTGAVQAADNLILKAGSDVIARSTLTTTNGNIEISSSDTTTYLYDDVTAFGDLYIYNNTIVKASGKTLKSTGDDVILAQDKTLVSEYDLTIEADDDIKLGMDTSGGNQQGWIGSGGDVTTEGDLILDAGDDIYAHGNLISNNGDIEIYSSDLTTYLGGDVTAAENVLLNNNTKLNGSGEQTVEAGGTLTANGYVRKYTSGDMWLLARGTDEGSKSIDLLYNDDGPGTSTYNGNLWILGAGDVQISDDVTTFGPSCSHLSGTPCSGWETGGVAIVSQEGKIYTAGDADETLNVSVTGNSDHELGLGIYNPSVEEDARAAIAIVSPEELKIGDSAKLEAFGRYYDDVDDRSAISFLDKPDIEIPVEGPVRNEGDPFDIAIYIASLDSDVTVTAATSILSREPIEDDGEGEYECVPKGAMVIDAKTNIILGGEFVTSLESEAVGGRAEAGDRLELASRDTEWLDDATGRLPLPSNFTLPDGYVFVLRGAGLENPDISDGRAWVLENRPVENAPLGQMLIPATQGCPALMKWAAEELGIDERRIYIWAEIALAFDMDIQPCDACARLKDAATILQDTEGTYIAALVMAVNQFVSVTAPLSEEQMASIADAIARHSNDNTYYATAGQWLNALTVYFGVLSTDMGWSLDEAVALVTDKYVAPAIEGGDANLTAFIAMRLADLGG